MTLSCVVVSKGTRYGRCGFERSVRARRDVLLYMMIVLSGTPTGFVQGSCYRTSINISAFAGALAQD